MMSAAVSVVTSPARVEPGASRAVAAVRPSGFCVLDTVLMSQHVTGNLLSLLVLRQLAGKVSV